MQQQNINNHNCNLVKNVTRFCGWFLNTFDHFRAGVSYHTYAKLTNLHNHHN